ncbi:hypothetical protein ADN00_05325 [Ornatilinea apprima]|uniref:Response regulatory domain-containing protein n=1 Tax=Ornatilinea apprima TaxID=1134406 RepID=A0A0P6XU67_9CHLR|nr:hypothetical protein [Ornatilinea apprima]KPL78675.1 hypothetical protein ADN00_05325 [Ornatilinea apprima]
MTQNSSKHILVIAPASRKRENLLAMFALLNPDTSIQIADDWRTARKYLVFSSPDVFLVDYRNPDDELNQEISSLLETHPCQKIVLLKNRICQRNPFFSPAIQEVIYDDISTNVLTLL